MSAGRLRRHQRDWDELAEVDPLWAILSDPSRRGGRWQLDEFFASGERELTEVLTRAESYGPLKQWERALDFGCGVGRLTRAMSTRFRECVGVDISDRMVKLARELNEDRPNCRFVVNDSRDLSRFESQSMDLVYSTLVLQHVPTPGLAKGYIREFLRVLRPGGLAIFQVPDHIPWRFRLQPTRRLYRLLRRAHVSAATLHERLRLTPMRMIAVPEPIVRQLVSQGGGTVEIVDAVERNGHSTPSRVYYARLA